MWFLSIFALISAGHGCPFNACTFNGTVRKHLSITRATGTAQEDTVYREEAVRLHSRRHAICNVVACENILFTDGNACGEMSVFFHFYFGQFFICSSPLIFLVYFDLQLRLANVLKPGSILPRPPSMWSLSLAALLLSWK